MTVNLYGRKRERDWDPFLFFALALPVVMAVALSIIITLGIEQHHKCSEAGGVKVRGACIEQEHVINLKEQK